jgi:hypothetical protein
MIQTHQPCDPRIHELAIRLARACRYVIQSCLRDEEKGEADREFYLVIRQGLEEFEAKDR